MGKLPNVIQPAKGPSVWRGADMVARRDWLHQLSPRQIADADAALVRVEQRGLSLGDIGRDDFPLPSWNDLILTILAEMEGGEAF